MAITIDSTGSMTDQIAAARSSALQIVQGLKTRYHNLRVGLADYKDNGDSYIVRSDLQFTSTTDEMSSAVDALSAYGGGDIQEAVYSAAKFGLTGGLGQWRNDPVKRLIVMIADAGGKDPEPWSGGSSSSEVAQLANIPGKEVRIYSLTPGDTFLPPWPLHDFPRFRCSRNWCRLLFLSRPHNIKRRLKHSGFWPTRPVAKC